jgi:zinc protease
MHEALTLPEIPFERHTLANGLAVVLHPDRRLPLVAINLWYHVGSKNERPGRTGLAHLFEHMLFQGSANVGTNDHFRYIQQAGGVANGSTWYDRTNYYETVPAHQLDLGLWLESDRMGFLLPALTAEKLETQRGVVMNERRQRVDNQPYGRALERLHELLFPPDHPYHWPVIGYMPDIEAATLEDVQRFFAVHYAPNNAVLTLAGDFDTSEALDKIDGWFGGIPASAAAPAVRLSATPHAVAREVMRDRVQLSRVYLAYRTPAYGQREWYAGALLALALAGGKASAMFQDLVYRREIAQDVGIYLYPTELEAMLLIVGTAKPGVAPAALETALREHVAKATSEPLEDDLVDRVRRRLLTAACSELESLDSRAEMLSQATTLFGDPGAHRRELEIYKSLSTTEIQHFAARHLGDDAAAVLHVIPEEGA